MDVVANRALLESQASDLKEKYQSLRLEWLDEPVVLGTLRFHADYEGKDARGQYEIRICIPDGYPAEVPSVYETGGRVQEGFHKYHSGALCLGAPIAVKKTFLDRPTLLGFVESLVIPYLFSHAYWSEHGEMPFGELAHGASGSSTTTTSFLARASLKRSAC